MSSNKYIPCAYCGKNCNNKIAEDYIAYSCECGKYFCCSACLDEWHYERGGICPVKEEEINEVENG